MSFRSDSLEEALQALGDVLAARGGVHDLALVGGGALLVLGLIDRSTKDLDVVARIEDGGWRRAEPFPAELADAVRDVARALDLPHDWLNPGPTDLLDLGLPVGFEERTVIRRYGALTVRLASRTDPIAFKLHAAVDQGADSKHFADLQKLAPAPSELVDAARWTRTHDPSDGFASMLRQALAALGVDDADV